MSKFILVKKSQSQEVAKTSPADSKNSTDTSAASPSAPKRKQGSRNTVWKILSGAVVILIVTAMVICVNLFLTSVQSGFSSAYKTASASTYESFYQNGYEKGETKYHTSNEAVINVNFVTDENTKLEVLTVAGTSYQSYDFEEGGIWLISDLTGWFKDSGEFEAVMNGDAVYTIDLNRAEIIADSAHKYIKVILPEPVLGEVSLSKDIVYLDSSNNRSTFDQGSDAAKVMLAKAKKDIAEDLQSNQDWYQMAKDSGISLVTSMIKNVNPDIPDLTIEVEYDS